MDRGGYGRGRSGHYRGGPRGRDGGRSGGGPPRGRGGSDRGGSGRGGGRNAGGSSVWKAFLSSQSPNSASDPVPEMENLQISPSIPSSSHIRDTEIFPIPRPDGGGALEKRTSKLHVNHFPIRFNPHAMLRHYNVYVKVKPTSPVTADRPQIISKSELSSIREKLVSNEPALFSKTVYDGVKNIISAVRLPKDTFEVTISAGGV